MLSRLISHGCVLGVLAHALLVPSLAHSDPDAVVHIGAQYMTGGGIDVHSFTGALHSSGMYGTVNLALKMGQELPELAVNDVFGGHVGWFFGGSDELAFGLGWLWGVSTIGDGSDEGDGIGHYGVEFPILKKMGDGLPIIFLPFWEVLGGGRRYGSNVIASAQFLEPLSIHFEGGVYHNDLDYENSPAESGIGYNWSIGAGIDSW